MCMIGLARPGKYGSCSAGKDPHHIEHIALRPFPVITFKNHSEWEFRTAGTDARFIRGSEYDRINFDEAGLDLNGIIIKVLRGVRPDGYNTPRMARLDVTTSPTDALWLRERYDKGDPECEEHDLRRYRSLRVATWDNTMLTEDQVEAMKAEYPPDMIDVEMGGFFPDYGFSMFPPVHVQACTDQSLYDAAYIAINPEEGAGRKGYRLDEDPRHGIIHFEVPPEPGRLYIMAGDPGTGNYPPDGHLHNRGRQEGHPQDIVITLAELSHLIRFLPAEPDPNSKPEKANHRNRRQRTTAGRRQR